MSTLFLNAKLVGSQTKGKLHTVLVEDGLVKRIQESSHAVEAEESCEKIDLNGLWLSPSFVDHQ